MFRLFSINQKLETLTNDCDFKYNAIVVWNVYWILVRRKGTKFWLVI